MQIFRGDLDNVSRSATAIGELVGSRVSSVSLPDNGRICSSALFSLVGLTNDAQVMFFVLNNIFKFQFVIISIRTYCPSLILHNKLCFLSFRVVVPKILVLVSQDTLYCFYICYVSDFMCVSLYIIPQVCVSASNKNDDEAEEEDDLKLQKAIEEMRRLDKILSVKALQEQEARQKRKELSDGLWRELLVSLISRHIYTVDSIKHYALLMHLRSVGVFCNPNCFFSLLIINFVFEQWNTPKGPSECVHEASNTRSYLALEAPTAQGKICLNSFDVWAVSVKSGQGYTPEPPDLKHLNDIDSRIRLLLPVEEFASLQASFSNLSETFTTAHRLGICPRRELREFYTSTFSKPDGVLITCEVCQ
uniref:Fibrous sheath-interacting protein 1 n=1 Tax=Neogobius melanostomus TaxID=47308 RepID=A0A8C6U4D0_9GOBI